MMGMLTNREMYAWGCHPIIPNNFKEDLMMRVKANQDKEKYFDSIRHSYRYAHAYNTFSVYVTDLCRSAASNGRTEITEIYFPCNIITEKSFNTELRTLVMKDIAKQLEESGCEVEFGLSRHSSEPAYDYIRWGG